MTDKKKSSKKHYFIDGYVSPWGTLGLLAYPLALKDTGAEFTTFYVKKDANWAYEKYEMDSSSLVGFIGPTGQPAWMILGKRGEIVTQARKDRLTQIIPEAGTGPNRYGYLNKIAAIDGGLYICGYSRQVYMLNGDKWVHIDQGILLPPNTLGPSLQSIDGSDRTDIYSVGLDGEMWHYDGKIWDRVDLPTNLHLFEVHCVNSQQVYACGARGTVIRGSGTKWDILLNETFVEDIWGVASFRGEVYVSGFGGIAKVVGDRIELVDTGLKKKFPSYRLRASEEALWSIGNDHMLRFDGNKWAEVVCPDNK